MTWGAEIHQRDATFVSARVDRKGIPSKIGEADEGLHQCVVWPCGRQTGPAW